MEKPIETIEVLVDATKPDDVKDIADIREYLREFRERLLEAGGLGKQGNAGC